MEHPTPESEIGVVGRILRVFYAPSETFESLARQQSAADWFVPIAIAAVLSIVIASATIPIATKASFEAMQEQMQNMPPEQREMMEKGQGLAQTGGMIAAPIMTFVFLLIASVLLLVLGKLLGATLTFNQAMPIYAYGSMIGILKGLIVTPLMVAKESMIVHTGLGLFLSDEVMQTFVGRLLAGVDLFTIWQAVVTAIGLAIVGQISNDKALGGVLVLVLIGITIGAALGSLNPAFNPGG